MKNVFFLNFCFCFCVQNYVFLLKIVCKEKNIQKGNIKKLYVEYWILAQQSWVNQFGIIATVQKKKKKYKVANQNGTVDEKWKMLYKQCKNTVKKRAQINDQEKIKK